MNNLLFLDFKTRIFKHHSIIDRKTRILLLTYPVSLTISCLRQNLSSSPFTGGEPLRVNNEEPSEPVSDTWGSSFPPVCLAPVTHPGKDVRFWEKHPSYPTRLGDSMYSISESDNR
jgi:hypothetical protein